MGSMVISFDNKHLGAIVPISVQRVYNFNYIHYGEELEQLIQVMFVHLLFKQILYMLSLHCKHKLYNSTKTLRITYNIALCLPEK